MKFPLRRFQKPALVTAALIGALLLTLFRNGQTGFAFRAPAADDALQLSNPDDDYRAFRLRILSQVIMLVHERYIEPDRINWREMLLGGLDYIQRSVAEVIVSHEDDADSLTVRVNTAEQSFSLADLDRPWALTFRFREIFLFIRANLRDENVDMRELEYAACNGVLHTLDPHSVLLDPELYEEMRLGTRGEFGGLGIVISIRDGQLTIISPIDETPADRAGLRSMDRIVMIGDETTINMTLEEAVDRLRGPPGTTVSIRVMRRGWSEPRPFDITRAVIRIESVESELLPGGVGYIKIRNFQGNTHDDLLEHLARLRQRGMRSLVLDLRDDPGGLLDQAIRVADTFLSEGVIVTTAGNDPTEREVRQAQEAHTEPFYPMVVLVNSGSASASEIVAGALKGNNRALIVGERTFGKGSVQVLYDFDDGSALKLTIAHYLTPGDVSIQSVGIVPDIEVLRLVVRQNRVDLVPDESSLRESSLEAHLAGSSERPSEQPAYRIRHYRVPEPPSEPPRQGEVEGQTESGTQENTENADADAGLDGGDANADGGSSSDEARAREEEPLEENENEEQDLLEDFEVRLAHDLLRRGSQGDRQALLERAELLINARQATEDLEMIDGLRHLGVDWSEGQDRGQTRFHVEVIAHGDGDDGRAGEVDAGRRLELTVRVRNDGDRPIYRLHAQTDSDNPFFDERELPFGRVNPGETREWTLRLGVPRDAQTRTDPIRIEFSELHDHAPPPQQVSVTVRGLTRPTFSYAYQVVDNEGGNGDGRISRGERVRLLVTVANQGPGQTYNAQANIKNESGEGVLIHDGRFDLGQLSRDQHRSHAFELQVLPSYRESEIEVELAITDIELREEVAETLRFSIVEPDEALPEATGRARVASKAPVFEWAHSSGHQVGWLDAGATVELSAERNGFVRISIDDERSVWIERTALETRGVSSDTTIDPRFVLRMDNTPPEVSFAAEPPLQIQGDQLDLRGTIVDQDRVLDMYIYVGRHKVFYLSNREGRDERRLDFSAPLTLEPGSNFILVVARESNDVIARRILIVRSGDGSTQSESAQHSRGSE